MCFFAVVVVVDYALFVCCSANVHIHIHMRISTDRELKNVYNTTDILKTQQQQHQHNK